ncbi:MAG: VanZ family protein [Cyclobacterium sp.]|uniref:VanZ family protein n=1 Tax=unclassified Cyclobacterium TaxID=2615055 RepID=UPI0013D4E96B|nr:VanZ family protein [Cyclobacterium sp. SYSU L10401]
MAYALFTPGSDVPDIPKFYGSDKLIHFGMFAGMVFLWSRVIRRKLPEKSKKTKKYFTNYLVLWIIIAIFTEYLQILVPGRSFDYLDIVTNILGGTIGTIIFVYLNKKGSILV